jgi:predicted PurR-regulated permease PerM
MNFDKRYLGAGASLLVVGLIAYYFSDVITWVVLAWIVSLLGSPIMKLLAKLKFGTTPISASFRAFMVLLLFGGIFAGVFALFVPVVVQQGRNLAAVDYAKLVQGLEEPLSLASDWLIERNFIEGNLSKYSIKDSVSGIKKDSINNNSKSILQTTPNTLTTPNDTLNVPNDTLAITINPNDSLNGGISTLNIDLDSLANIQSKNNSNVNNRLIINISIADNFSQKTDISPIIPVDTAALVKNDDSLFEKAKKKVFSYFNPSKILTEWGVYVMSFFGNFVLLVSSVSFISFFFLKDEELFARGIKSAVPDQYIEKVDAALAQIIKLLTRYFGGILLQIGSLAVYLGVFLGITGVESALLIAVFGAVMNIIPYVGLIIGLLFGLLIAVSSHLDAPFYTEMLPLMIWVAVAFITMHILDAFLLQPIIFSSSILAHPLEIFIVIIAGAKIGGILGMVVALPLYTIFRVIAAEFFSQFKIVKSLTEHLDNDDKSKI